MIMIRGNKKQLDTISAGQHERTTKAIDMTTKGSDNITLQPSK